MTGKRTRAVRLVLAVLFALPVVVGATVTGSLAAPSKEDVQAAKGRLDQLNQQLEIAAEAYNDAGVRLDQAEARLADAQRAKQSADAEAAKWRDRLSSRAVEAYTGMGSQVDVLLEAEDISEFSDRLQYMGAIAQSDTDLATKADAAGDRARMAADELASAVDQRQTELDDMAAQRDQIQATLDEQEILYRDLNQQYQDALAAQQQALLLAQQQQELAQQADPTPTTDTTPPTTPPADPSGPYIPSPNASQAQIAIDAAMSVRGTGYVWGSADPNVGFDCSGLTSWAYAQADVYLPHSSVAQYAALPHISRDQLQPGDLIFFFSPIHHVAIYLGGGTMIDTIHPGADGVVAVRAVWWSLYTGAARPT
jgi:cell wall-associated NlpC family hydrolase